MQIVRRFEFDMGHRVYGHGGKCKHPHGHRYTALVTMETGVLNELGMVVDFGDVKTTIGGWIDRVMDHGFCVFREDTGLLEAFSRVDDTKLLIVDFNPTAENLAQWMLDKLRLGEVVPAGVTITQITLFETPNCWAIAK